jgi:hypothetical protein
MRAMQTAHACDADSTWAASSGAEPLVPQAWMASSHCQGHLQGLGKAREETLFSHHPNSPTPSGPPRRTPAGFSPPSWEWTRVQGSTQWRLSPCTSANRTWPRHLVCQLGCRPQFDRGTAILNSRADADKQQGHETGEGSLDQARPRALQMIVCQSYCTQLHAAACPSGWMCGPWLLAIHCAPTTT